MYRYAVMRRPHIFYSDRTVTCTSNNFTGSFLFVIVIVIRIFITVLTRHYLLLK